MTEERIDVIDAQEPPDWDRWPAPARGVVKIVVGTLGGGPAEGEAASRRKPGGRRPAALPADLAKRFPDLTHLHVWGLDDLGSLPELPPGLLCLDVRKCPGLAGVRNLPSSLEELVIEDAAWLGGLPLGSAYPALADVSLKGLAKLRPDVVRDLLARAPALRALDVSGLALLDRVPVWPESLDRIEANDCPLLDNLPPAWPGSLRRLGLRNCARVSALPDLPDGIDYLDLRGTKGLEHLPDRLGAPRTMFIHDSGLALPPELFGEEDANRAAEVLAHLGGKRVPYHEVKVILLGNGRSGKSSLARRLVENAFDPHERTTHGIRLWEIPEFPFEPVDESGAKATARLHIWDFAGQDLYHNTHRLFFQAKAVFVICETAAGDGSDKATDGTDDDGLPEDWDVDRALPYWRDQIESLGPAPGTDRLAPMLFVRTKSDRDGELTAKAIAGFRGLRREALKGLERVEFSAKATGGKSGMDALRTWLAGAVATVLGERGRREVNESALEVIHALQDDKRRNDVEHAMAESENRPARPPCPTMTRAEFDAVVRDHCKGGRYHDHPGLLLDFLHLGGFLYADARHLPDTVVLDQRWAIEGIYTAFDRKHGWPELRALHGRCTEEDLVDWGWRQYDRAHHRLFLDFMTSCGMAFAVGTNGQGQEEYVVPGALPMRDAAVDGDANHHRAGARLVRTLTLRHGHLGRDAALGLVVSLGREWGRAGQYWLWGAQFESFRGYRGDIEERPADRTFVVLDWRPNDGASFGGVLTLEQFGPDGSFLRVIVERCRKFGTFVEAQIEAATRQLPPDVKPDIYLGQERIFAGRDPATERGASHKPTRWLRDVMVVGISFAGNEKNARGGSIEALPRLLTEHLKRKGIDVNQYREDQSRPEVERVGNRVAFTKRLLRSHFVFVFVSPRFLTSKWCMWEFWEVLNQCALADKEQDRRRCWIGAFDGGRFSQSAPDSDGETKFRGYWEEELKTFTAALPADPFESERAIARHAYASWMRALRERGDVNRVVDALTSSGGWTVHALGPPPGSCTVLRMCIRALNFASHTRDVLCRSAETWWDWAKSEGEAASRRAMKCFVRGVLGCDPDGQPDGLEATLKKSLGQHTLDQIRRAVLEHFQTVTGRGRTITTWQDLDESIVVPEFPSTSRTPGRSPPTP